MTLPHIDTEALRAREFTDMCKSADAQAALARAADLLNRQAYGRVDMALDAEEWVQILSALIDAAPGDIALVLDDARGRIAHDNHINLKG